MITLSFIIEGFSVYAADEEENTLYSITNDVISFEISNPVTSITYQTGDSVNIDDFPFFLTAVVSFNINEMEFTQIKPDNVDRYIAPENAEELYKAGEFVVYTTENGAEYRVYGEVGEEKGGFACSDDGLVLIGIVRDLLIYWDIFEINTAAAGDYTATGCVDGYTLSCPAPIAAVRVNAKSGDQNIATHSLTWISGSTSTEIDGDKVSINIPSVKSLERTTISNMMKQFIQ